MSARGGDYAVDEIARAWWVKMRGDDAQAIRGEFKAWLAEASAHRDAYERVSRTMNASAILKTSSRFGSEAARRRRAAAGWRMPWGSIAAGVLLMLAVAGTVTMSSSGPTGLAPSARANEPLTTRRGEIRTFRLPDGSTATLDTLSRLELSYSTSERRVRLVRGRVRLTVMREERPFIAEASAGATAVRTEEAVFDLKVEDGRSEVALLTGQAATFPLFAPGTASVRPSPIAARERLVLSGGGGAVETTRAAPMAARGDWPSGWAEFDRIALGALAAEANRYAVRPVVVDDEALAGLAVSGRFYLKDTDVFVRRVADLFGLAVSERPDGIHLTRG